VRWVGRSDSSPWTVSLEFDRPAEKLLFVGRPPADLADELGILDSLSHILDTMMP